MAATEMIRVRIDADTKQRCKKMYEARGITTSDAIWSFLEDELASFEERVDQVLVAS